MNYEELKKRTEEIRASKARKKLMTQKLKEKNDKYKGIEAPVSNFED